jgi:type IV pilus assembly protein PilB
MSHAKAIRERLGDLLVQAGLVSTSQLQEALEAQKSSGMRLGKQLVALGHVSELQLAQTLSNQLSIPWVSLDRIEFSHDLLARVPAELAERYTLMPIYVRSVRHQGDTLYVAMEDPTDELAQKEVSAAAGLPVRAMIAAPGDIRRAIDRHYFVELSPEGYVVGGLRDAVERAVSVLPKPPTPAAPPAAAKRAKPAPPPHPGKAPGKKPPPPPSDARGDGSSTGAERVSHPGAANTNGKVAGPEVHKVPLQYYETPSEPPAQHTRVLTLLDGTRVAVPPTGAQRFAQDVTEVRHVIRAIRAASADAGIDQAPTWHEVVQVLLDALHARGFRLSRKDIGEAFLRLRERKTAGD